MVRTRWDRLPREKGEREVSGSKPFSPPGPLGGEMGMDLGRFSYVLRLVLDECELACKFAV